MDDLKLKELGGFTGTTAYHNVLGVNVTDGIAYIMRNGYSWVVTDAIAVIIRKLKTHPFLSVKLKLNNGKADMIIENGNTHRLYKQHYSFTNAKRELLLFFTNNVLMVNSEY